MKGVPNKNLTDDPTDSRLHKGIDKEQVPQQEVYLVLPEAERAKGFVRPFRDTYQHVGVRPKYPLRDLTDEERDERQLGATFGYVKFEAYPESESPITGRFWTQAQLDAKACGTVTTMGRELSETYARDPKFYGATYCCACMKHLPVEEFAWAADGECVGS